MKYHCLPGENDQKVKELGARIEQLEQRQQYLKAIIINDRRKINLLEKLLNLWDDNSLDPPCFDPKDKPSAKPVNIKPSRSQEKSELPAEERVEKEDENEKNEVHIKKPDEDDQENQKTLSDSEIENVKEKLKRLIDDCNTTNTLSESEEEKSCESPAKKQKFDGLDQKENCRIKEEDLKDNEEHLLKEEDRFDMANDYNSENNKEDSEYDDNDLEDEEEESEDTVSMIDSMMETQEDTFDDNDDKHDEEAMNEDITNTHNEDKESTSDNNESGTVDKELAEEKSVEIKSEPVESSIVYEHSPEPLKEAPVKKKSPPKSVEDPVDREQQVSKAMQLLQRLPGFQIKPVTDTSKAEAAHVTTDTVEVKFEPVEEPSKEEENKLKRKNLKNSLSDAWKLKNGREEREKPRRRTTCKKCSGCQVMNDCGLCYFCIDKPKFGGNNKLKRRCRERICINMS